MIGKDTKYDAEYQRQLTKINKIIYNVEDLTPVFGEFIKSYRNMVNKQFETEGAFFGGGKWQALSLKYAAEKAVLRPGRKILQYNKVLLESAIGKRRENVIENIYPDSMEIGIKNVPYAKKHQTGDKSTRLPRREFYYKDGKLPVMAITILRVQLEDYIKSVVELARSRGVI